MLRFLIACSIFINLAKWREIIFKVIWRHHHFQFWFSLIVGALMANLILFTAAQLLLIAFGIRNLSKFLRKRELFAINTMVFCWQAIKTSLGRHYNWSSSSLLLSLTYTHSHIAMLAHIGASGGWWFAANATATSIPSYRRIHWVATSNTAICWLCRSQFSAFWHLEALRVRIQRPVREHFRKSFSNFFSKFITNSSFDRQLKIHVFLFIKGKKTRKNRLKPIT